MTPTIYLDHHATTPLDPRVLEAMMPYLTAEFGNPSSATHDYGRRARAAVETARASVARLLGARPEEIVFTAGATEANNLALKGAARMARKRGRGTHLVTTSLEHESVAYSVRALEEDGFAVTVVPPGSDGIVRPVDVERAIRPDTVLVTAIWVNGEIGTIQPVAALASLARERGALFHTDATQGVGKLPIDVRAAGIHLLALSAHKFYGPKGVGALFLENGVELEPLFSGGGQERGLRSGTLNVPGIVGLGAVADLRRAEMDEEAKRLSALRDALWSGIRERVPDARLNGDPERRLPGNLNVSFPGVPARDLLQALDGFALSAGSACRSTGGAPSEILEALGLDADLAASTLRFGLGRGTTPEHVERLLAALGEAVRRLRPQTAS
jgi:cysteine desulfurase